jgi:HTH-type transcriptional regulator / antitoxin HigA
MGKTAGETETPGIKESEMRTGRKSRKESDTYFELIHQFPLRPLRDDEELDRAIQVVDSLLDRNHLGQGEKDYLNVLSGLVESYEAENHPMPPASDAEMLRHLIEAKNVAQSQVAKANGIAESTISEILAGKRALNRGQIGKLSRYFHVEPTVFRFEP